VPESRTSEGHRERGDGVCGGSADGVGEDQAGGGLGRVSMQFGQDAGVCIGGQHDAGMSELGLDRLEVRTGGQGETGCAVPQIMQTYWWQAGVGDQVAEPAGQPVGAAVSHPLR
jgi:hypothetical protein